MSLQDAYNFVTTRRRCHPRVGMAQPTPVVVCRRRTPPQTAKLIRATVATVSKTKELKKRSWGQERVGLVSFGSCLPCERFALLSVLELMCVAQKRRC